MKSVNRRQRTDCLQTSLSAASPLFRLAQANSASNTLLLAQRVPALSASRKSAKLAASASRARIGRSNQRQRMIAAKIRAVKRHLSTDHVDQLTRPWLAFRFLRPKSHAHCFPPWTN